MQRHTWLAVLGLAAGASTAQAQVSEGFGSECGTVSTIAQAYCYRVAEAVQVVLPRVGIALTGGNPVPGTASTMGMRLGAMPRISIGLRASGAAVKVGGIESVSDDDEMTFGVPALSVDGAIGVFSGVGLGPTLGGLGSIDLLASIGTIPLPDGEGFDGSPVSWAAGARVGILRESFTAPGISLSGMYRKLGEVEFGDTVAGGREGYFQVDDLSVWSLRGAISKRLLGFGLTAGAGHDRYSSAVQLIVDDPFAVSGRRRLGSDELESSRTTFFGNASLTMLILQLVVEGGWQSGGDPDFDEHPEPEQLDKSGYYGSLALRVTL